MVDIIIGQVAPTGPPTNRHSHTGTPIEAQILNIRDPRKNRVNPEGEERRKEFRQDPVNGRILTILVPNGISLPKDLDGKQYKVILRFMKK